MATDVERLVIRLEASMKGYERELAKQRGNTDRELKNIESRFSKTEGVIGSFGKGLLGAAAGALSLDALSRAAVEAANSIAKIGETAKTVGLDTDFFQTLEFAAMQEGVKGLTSALETFTARSDEAAQGTGTFFDKIKASNPALAEQIRLAKDQEERLRLTADAIQKVSSAEEKAAIARAAFGKAGVEMVRILGDGSQGLDDFAKAAQDAGIIIDRDLIKRADELGDKLDVARKVITVEFQRALVDLMPTLIETARLIGTVAQAANRFIDVFRDVGNRSTASLEGQLSLLQQAKETLEKNPATFPVNIDKAALVKEIADLEAELDRRKTKINVPVPGGERARATSGDSKDPFDRTVDSIQKRQAILDAETRTIDLNSAARARAKVVAELETAAKKANADAGLANTEVTAAQAAKINEVADAYEKVALAAEKANSPLARFAREAGDVSKQIEDSTVNALHSMEDAFVGIITGTESVSDAFKKMANAIISDLIRISIRQSITGPIASALGGLGGGGAGAPLDLMSFMRASGGPVRGGQPYIVGERGPEIVVPHQSGTVIPNDVSRSMGGGISLSFSPVIDARGSSMSEGQMRAILAEHGAQIRRDVVPIVRQAQSRRAL